MAQGCQNENCEAPQQAAKNTQEPAKSFATETLPTLRKHLETAQALERAR